MAVRSHQCRSRVKLLFVEDSPADRALLQAQLSRLGPLAPRLELATCLAEAEVVLRSDPPELVLLDLGLPDADGLGGLQRLLALAPSVPVVVLTGIDDHEAAREAVKAGAQDFLVKGELEAASLMRVVSCALERAEGRRALVQANERHELVLQGARDCFWDWDINTGAATFSPRFAEMLAIDPMQLRGDMSDWLDRVHSADIERLRGQLDQLLSGESSSLSCDHRVLDSDGGFRVILARAEPARDASGKVVRLAGSLSDVTEQRNSEANILCHAGHELRSPVHAAGMLLAVVCDGLAGDLRPEQAELLGRVRKNIERLGGIINDLLDSRRMAGGNLTLNLRRQALGPVIELAAEPDVAKAQAKGVRLSWDIAPDLPAACIDPARVRQVVLNLLDNAIKFVPEGGNVVLTAGRSAGGRELEVSVRDDGCGLPPDACELVFEQLYQERSNLAGSREGLGLGLFIAREIVVAHGGRMWVESREGEGADFRFTVPVFDLSGIVAASGLQEPLLPATLVQLAPGPGQGRRSSGATPRWAEDARAVVGRAMDGVGELLLPALRPLGEPEELHLLLLGDPAATRGRAEQLARQLETLPEMVAYQLEWGTELIELGAPAPGEGLDARLAHAVDELLAGGLPVAG